MEFIDVLNENGKRTGIVRNRKLIYKNGDWHKTVHVWLMNDKNELLMQKRAKDKETFPNLWAISIAGHVMSGETSKEAALREIKEEIDINIFENDLIYMFSVRRNQPYKDGMLHVLDDVYLLRNNLDIQTTNIQEEELSDIKFINYKELKQNLMGKNPLFVPYSKEHELLFKYLSEHFNLD